MVKRPGWQDCQLYGATTAAMKKGMQAPSKLTRLVDGRPTGRCQIDGSRAFGCV